MPDPKLRVMISSRCRDNFPPDSERTLSDIRICLKRWIESSPDFYILGESPFEVWINEEEPPQGGSWDNLDTCLEAVKSCDILLAISNGNAGWGANAADDGICHLELKSALDLAAAKVRLIELYGDWNFDDDDMERNSRFTDLLKQRRLFRGKSPRDEEQLRLLVKQTLRRAVLDLVKNGVREASRGGGPTGQSLDWSRLSFLERKQEMENALRSALRDRGAIDVDQCLLTSVGGETVVFMPHAIPDALSVTSARELVGQPFLLDHRLADLLIEERGGPVHVIACQKTATETQARRMLGFPDATVVSAPFGIYVADNIQKVQFAFLVNCRDEQNTRYATQLLFEWLERTGEDVLLAARSRSRANIVNTIASEWRP